MLDVQGLASPILGLLSGFGSGVLPTTDPTEALRLSSAAMESVYTLGRTGLDRMSASWSGTAADAAAGKVSAVQSSTATIADRGTSVADIVGSATADVSAGIAELGQILESFISLVVAAAPTLTTPAGQIMVIGAAIEHLGRALTVVARVRDQLSAHTARLLDHVVPEAVPTAPAISTSPGADAGTQFVSNLSQSVGGPPLSNIVSSFFGGSTPGTLPDSAVPGSPGVVGNGVEIRLPDGSTVVAPNEKAAAAVRHALSAQGTPYVWGGTAPGSGFDCSGLTQWAYAESGVGIPRTAAEQAVGMPVDPGSLMPGDLAVWDGHVAMVIGNGMLVEAGDPVEVSPLRTSNMGMAFHGFYRPTA